MAYHRRKEQEARKGDKAEGSNGNQRRMGMAGH